MMSYEITLPDPSTQHRKTPAWIRVFRTVLDAQGKPVKAAVKRFFTEGSGQNMRVLRWHEALDKIRDFVENRTLAELKALYERITGEAYAGVDSKKGVLRGVLSFWFGFDQDLTLAEMKAWALDHIKNNEGQWGLGCPNVCGRYWPLAVKNSRFILKDRAAWTGPQAEILEEWDDTNPGNGETTHYFKIRHWLGDERVVTEVPVNRGYLNVNPQEKTFICDRCEAVITLSNGE